MNCYEWLKKPAEWEDENCRYYSFVFSWDLWKWCLTAQPELDGKKIKIGGPAVLLNRDWVPDWVEIGETTETDVLQEHYIIATRTTTGCIRKCPFCAVPHIEGGFQELETWNQNNVLIDNNLLACSKRHFLKVIDSLKRYYWCDFSQGLDARLMKKWHVDKLAELKNPIIRLAWDEIQYESKIFQACELLEAAGIPKKTIKIYVLIGFNDKPKDALYRLKTVDEKGYTVFPMRFQPLNSKSRNEYTHKNWTDTELKRFMKYWCNKRYFAGIPFEDFDYNAWRKRKN